MEVVLEQFIPSDRSKRISNMLKNLAIIFGVAAILFVLGSIIIGLALAIAAAALFVGSYFMYIDFEYELYNGDITITKVYNASRRRIAQKINKGEVQRVYLTERKNAFRKGTEAYYNSNINGFNIYTFELSNNKVIQLALNEELEKIVKIAYIQKMRF